MPNICRWTQSKPSRKVRRHAGRSTPVCTLKAPKKEIIEACIEPQEMWDDWNDWRDGGRAWYLDGKKIKDERTLLRWEDYGFSNKTLERSKKQKRLLRIRKAKKKGRSGVVV